MCIRDSHIFRERAGEIAYAPASDPDYKGRLQELVARHFARPPEYQIRENGPDHAKEFHAKVLVNGAVEGTGDGGSKKKAEQAAAQEAWERLVLELEERDGGTSPNPTNGNFHA